MFKTILVPALGTNGDKTALEAAFTLGKPFHAHVDCLRVRLSQAAIALRVSVLDMPRTGPVESYIEALEKEDQKVTKAAKTIFEGACGAHAATAGGAPGAGELTAAWHEVSGDALWDTVAQARFHDLVVIDRSAEFSGGSLGSLIVSCGRPVLIPGAAAPKKIGSTIAIAWKETAEAARAVTAAMPLLEKAERVIVIAADEAGNEAAGTERSAGKLASALAWHGIKSETRLVEPGAKAAGAALFAEATKLGADLVVMGAYGHSRVREYIFGGFTRYVLGEATLPVLLFH